MKSVKAVVFLTALGFVAADPKLKTEKEVVDYLKWKEVAEKTEKVAQAKHDEFKGVSDKSNEKSKAKASEELKKVAAALDGLKTEVKKITSLHDSKFKGAKDDKEKKGVAEEAEKVSVTLAEKFLDFETVFKKGSLALAKEASDKDGFKVVYDFLKEKVGLLEKDGFLTTSLLAAGLLSALAVGSSLH